MTKHIDREKLLDWLGPDVDFSIYKSGYIPATIVDNHELRKAIRAGKLDVEPQLAPDLQEIRKALSEIRGFPWVFDEASGIIWSDEGDVVINFTADEEDSEIDLITNAPTWLYGLLAEVERLQSALDTRQDSIDVLVGQLTAEVEDHATTVVEAERLKRQIADHGPEGRNYTNAEYVALQRKLELERKWREGVQARNLKLAGEIAEEHSASAALLEGLQFYAAETTYDIMHLDREGIPIVQDKGLKARSLLSLYGGKGDTDAALE